MVLAGCVLLFCFAVDQLLLGPVISEKKRLTRAVVTKTADLDRMRELGARYQALQRSNSGAAASLAARKEGFTLFAFLEGAAGVTGLKSRIASMKPSTTTDRVSGLTYSVVEMKLEGLTMTELTRLLYEVETAPENVRIKGVSVARKGKEKARLSAVLKVQTVAG